MLFDVDNYIRNFDKIQKPNKKNKWTEVFEEMSIHTRKVKPEKTLLRKRPNEEKDVLEYRLNI